MCLDSTFDFGHSSCGSWRPIFSLITESLSFGKNMKLKSVSPESREPPSSTFQRELGEYQNSSYSPGRGGLVRLLWYYTSLCLFESSWFLHSPSKTRLLRLFGATVDSGLVIHPNVRIKYPWRLSVGKNCWIGREVWIDNLDDVHLESDVCLSQQAYLCTGSHDHRVSTFDLKTGPIVIEHGAWVCCRATVLGNSRVPRMEVVPAASVFSNKQASEGFPVRKPR